jgi:hypothetical protein
MTGLEIGYILVLVLALTQAVKKAGVSSRYLPLIALVLGVVGSYFFSGEATVLATAAGVITGLASAGLYDLGKKTVLGK